jgi:hypothetical protein
VSIAGVVPDLVLFPRSHTGTCQEISLDRLVGPIDLLDITPGRLSGYEKTVGLLGIFEGRSFIQSKDVEGTLCICIHEITPMKYNKRLSAFVNKIGEDRGRLP